MAIKAAPLICLQRGLPRSERKISSAFVWWIECTGRVEDGQQKRGGEGAAAPLSPQFVESQVQMNRGTARVAALLFFSGACALTYETTWLRQFRLIFGASTFATAAVLAIFMGGLGVGSALLGRRADAHPRPLAFYGNLELLISLSAALSPLLLWLVAKIYFAAGGSVTLGLFSATIVRLVLSALVLAVPTVLMGGTL